MAPETGLSRAHQWPAAANRTHVSNWAGPRAADSWIEWPGRAIRSSGGGGYLSSGGGGGCKSSIEWRRPVDFVLAQARLPEQIIQVLIYWTRQKWRQSAIGNSRRPAQIIAFVGSASFVWRNATTSCGRQRGPLDPQTGGQVRNFRCEQRRRCWRLWLLSQTSNTDRRLAQLSFVLWPARFGTRKNEPQKRGNEWRIAAAK